MKQDKYKNNKIYKLNMREEVAKKKKVYSRTKKGIIDSMAIKMQSQT